MGSTDIEILKGVQPGDIIVTGSFSVLRTLKNNTKVRIDNTPMTTGSQGAIRGPGIRQIPGLAQRGAAGKRASGTNLTLQAPGCQERDGQIAMATRTVTSSIQETMMPPDGRDHQGGGPLEDL